MFDLINLDTDESHGLFATLDEARGAARFDHLRRYQIWLGNSRIVDVDPDEDAAFDAAFGGAIYARSLPSICIMQPSGD
jgi:hypothetical protein